LFSALKYAIDQTAGIFAQQSLHLAWLPRVDGVFLTQPPFNSVENGAYAKIPMVSGDCDDEGTLFALTSAPTIVTDQQAIDYIHYNYAPNATAQEVADVALLYPSDPVQGSPYGTGYLNQLTPQFKRIASFTGDLVFQGPRRHFLNFASKTQNVWSYTYRRGKAAPFIGSFHS
jgi:acetylcholinesterase